MDKFMVNTDWIVKISVTTKEICMNFFELPRVPHIGNDDIEVIISNNRLQINGDDGYGSISDLKYFLRKKDLIGPCYEGWFPIQTGKWNIVEMFILLFKGVDFFAYEKAIRNSPAIVGEESWEYMCQEERNIILAEVYNLYCQE